MSLINEALKKAQAQKSASPQQDPQSAATAAAKPPPPPPPARSKRRFSYLWGFILSVLIVGALSFGLSYYFVSKLLVESETQANKSVTPVADLPDQIAEFPKPDNTAPPPPTPVPQSTALATENNPTQAKALAPVAPIAIADESQPPPTSTPAATSAPTPTPSPQASPVAASPPSLPVANADAAAFVEAIEIRGIMGGTRALIYDPVLGRNRAYERGDRIEAPMPLFLIELHSQYLIFKDDAGFQYRKPF